MRITNGANSSPMPRVLSSDMALQSKMQQRTASVTYAKQIEIRLWVVGCCTTHEVFQDVGDILTGLAALDDDGSLRVLVHLRLPLALRTQDTRLGLFRGHVPRRHRSLSRQALPSFCLVASHKGFPRYNELRAHLGDRVS